MIETNTSIPNFFLVGAPKCGTTSLSLYLRKHPDIYISKPKEPHFFSDDINNGGVKDLSIYLDCFNDAKVGCKTIGDASTLYLFSKTAIRNILEFNPDSRFIVMLRNPLEIAFSFHQLALKLFGEIETDFEKAWTLQGIRKKGKYIPHGCPDHKLLYYGEIAKLGFQVERLLSLVDSNCVHYILFDEFKENTKREYEKVLRFLGVDLFYQTFYPVHNPTRSIKHPIITKMVNQIIGIKKILGINNTFGIANKIHRFNTADYPPKQLNKSMQMKIITFFQDDIKLLSKLVKKDLSTWSYIK